MLQYKHLLDVQKIEYFLLLLCHLVLIVLELSPTYKLVVFVVLDSLFQAEYLLAEFLLRSTELGHSCVRNRPASILFDVLELLRVGNDTLHKIVLLLQIVATRAVAQTVIFKIRKRVHGTRLFHL